MSYLEPLYLLSTSNTSTYDHRNLDLAHPVRSGVLNQVTGGLVVRWVTTSEYPLLYVFAFLLAVSTIIFAWAMPSGRQKRREAFLDQVAWVLT
jgi:uncharacterized membrane protein HdeD (DUF308 family)